MILPWFGGGFGAIAAILIAPSLWPVLIGIVIGAGLTGLIGAYWRKTTGLRSIDDYPPMLKLREAGWHDPD